MDNVVQNALNTLYYAANDGQTYLYRMEDAITYYLQYGDQVPGWANPNDSAWYAWNAVQSHTYTEPCSGVVSGGANAIQQLKNACVLSVTGDDNFVGDYRTRAQHVLSSSGVAAAVNSAINAIWGARQNLASHGCACDQSATGGQYSSWFCGGGNPGGGGPDDPPPNAI